MNFQLYLQKEYLIGTVVLFISLHLFYYGIFYTLGFILLLIVSVVIGILAAFWFYIRFSTKHKTGAGIDKIKNELLLYHAYIFKNESNTISPSKYVYPVVFGRTVDIQVQQLLCLLLRDYVNIWIKDYAFESDKVLESMKEDLWLSIQSFHVRLRRLDHYKLIAVDLITKITSHFEKIRVAQTAVGNTGRPPVFSLSSHLTSTDKELEYLRKISQVIIKFLLPRGYSLTPTKYLLREIIACKILYPMINNLTEPDYINQKIVEYIETQKAAAEMHRKTYEYANSFEDFLNVLRNTKDVEALKQIRYNIMTEIMQATTMQNLNRAKGVDADNQLNQNIKKSDILNARKLKCYINQLTYAKGQCEKYLSLYGWEGYASNQSSSEGTLTLSSILNNIVGRRCLSKFLEEMAGQSLVGFWLAVEELRQASRSEWHQLGAEIFYTYIRTPTSEIKVDKNTRKKIEAFLLGDEGVDVFFEVQQTVVNTLQDKYYQAFIMSDHYKQMLDSMGNSTESDDLYQSDDNKIEWIESSKNKMDSPIKSNSKDDEDDVLQHSYAKKKLNQLEEKLNNKMQALDALRISLKPGSKAILMLEKEVEWLKGEKRQLEVHIARTDLWSENLGKWRAVVQNAEVAEDKEPQFVIIVHMSEDRGANDELEGDEGSTSSGWVVLRTLSDFQQLHRKLLPLSNEIRNLELPSNSFKFLFGKNSDRFPLDKAKSQIQSYLQFILENDQVNQCESLYSFLSPSSDHLKNSRMLPKKSKFSLSTFFKSGSNENGAIRENMTTFQEKDTHNISHYLDQPGTDDFDTKLNDNDQIAEPLYALLGEIFDMRGVFKFLRRSLITFVQVTYGRTINKQIRETIDWCFCESMVHYYLTIFIKSWWPGGELAPSKKPRTREQKFETALLARKQFVSNVPDVLSNLVGSQTAKRGALKVFEICQNHKMNKQLLYDLLEIFIQEMFPEITNQ